MRFRDEHGQTVVLAAFMMPVLIGFTALCLDVALIFRAKRMVQIAADAAVLSAAYEYQYNSSITSAQTAADAASAQNGLINGDGGVAVVLHVPPTYGPNAGKTGFTEVIVSKPVSMIFMGLFGFKTMTVQARAVSGGAGSGSVCIWVMSSNGASMNLQGSYDVEAPGCGIYVNSPASNAFSTTGNAGTVNAKFLEVVGNSPPAHQTYPTPTTINAAPRTSPFGNIPGPTTSNGLCTYADSSTSSLTGNIPGPGPGKVACYTKPVTIANATLGAGTYVFQNGVSLSGTVTVNSGTIAISGGTFSQGSATLNVTAPTSGTYNGIALMQPMTNTNQVQVQYGKSNSKFDGYIYAPGAQVAVQDNGGGTVANGIVASYLYVKSSTIRVFSYDAAHASTTPNRILGLVE